jgi:hypothetical protein
MATSSGVRAGEGDDPAPRLTVAAVARRLGIAPSTLRTWDRRYGLGPSAHQAGAHRRYSPADLDRLVVMRRLTLEGVPPAEAARLAVAMQPPALVGPVTRTPTPSPAGPASSPGPLLPPGAVGLPIADPPPRRRRAPAGTVPTIPAARDGGLGLPGRLLPPGPAGAVGPGPAGAVGPGPAGAVGPGSAGAVGPGPAAPVGRRASGPSCGGGRVFALPDAPQARGLARAAMALDPHETARILNEAIRADGVVATWTRLAVPLLQAVGERWRTTGQGVDVEHLLSETLLDVLRMVVARGRPPRRASPVLLGCVEDEYHTLPLHALAAALAERGIGCRLLGAGMPLPALVTAVRRTGPALVFLYARQPGADGEALGDLPRQRPAPRLVLGGPGWSGPCPPAARVVASLSEAVESVTAVLRG